MCVCLCMCCSICVFLFFYCLPNSTCFIFQPHCITFLILFVFSHLFFIFLFQSSFWCSNNHLHILPCWVFSPHCCSFLHFVLHLSLFFFSVLSTPPPLSLLSPHQSFSPLNYYSPSLHHPSPFQHHHHHHSHHHAFLPKYANSTSPPPGLRQDAARWWQRCVTTGMPSGVFRRLRRGCWRILVPQVWQPFPRSCGRRRMSTCLWWWRWACVFFNVLILFSFHLYTYLLFASCL